MKKVFAHILLFLATSFFSMATYQTAAQESPAYRVQYSDSLVLESGARFLTNTFLFQNQQNDTLSIHLRLSAPSGWQIMNKQRALKLSPGEAYAVPLSLAPSSSTPSEWQAFQLLVQSGSKTQTDTFVFWCKPFPVTRYSAVLLSKQAELANQKDSLNIRLRLGNTGNTRGSYRLQFQNNFFQLRKTITFGLMPGADTVYTFSLAITNEKWKTLNRETISIRLQDTTGNIKLLLFDVQKLHTTLKQNKSAYETIPVELESGMMLNNKQLSYFGVVKGRVALKENTALDVSYKTKEMGAFNLVQSDVLNVRLTTPKLLLFAGQMTDAKNFVGFGNGIKASYTQNNRELYVSGTLHNKNFYYRNDQFEAGIRHQVNGVKLDQTIAVNFDPASKVNSYLLLNKAEIFKKQDFLLTVNGGLGIDIPQATASGSGKKLAPAIGYQANYHLQKLYFTSVFQSNSRYFPGLNKGLLDQNHRLNWRSGILTLSAFLQSNKRVLSVFRDTLYNSDFLSYNTQRLGLFTGVRMRKMNIGFSFGQFTQFGNSSSSSLDHYNFAEGYYFWQPSKNFRTSFSSFNGYGKLNAQQPPVWINSTTANVNFDRFSITGLYTRNPQIANDSAGKRLLFYNETTNLTPSFNLVLFKRLFINFSYTLSQTSYDDHLTSYCSGSVAYIGKNNGLSLNLYGMAPVKKSNANSPGLKSEYFTLSIRKKFSVPVLFKRRYHDLTVIPFFDDNNNGKKDNGEKTLENTPVRINATAFSTNRKGQVSYRNISKGDYTLDLNSVAGYKGFVPAQGAVQKIRLEKSMTVQVPFKRSKMIIGKISVELDSLSTVRFTPGGIKVVVTDSLNRQYSTLADEQGNFTLSVPANVYLVSLNPDAFDDKIKPEVMAYNVDLTTVESAKVHFFIKQQKRKIRLLKN